MRRQITPEKILSRSSRLLLSKRRKTPGPRLDLTKIIDLKKSNSSKIPTDDNLSSRYLPSERKFVCSITGEIEINNFKYMLSNPSNIKLGATQQLNTEVKPFDVNSYKGLTKFKEEAKKIEKVKPDYITCLKKSLKELIAMGVKSSQLSKLQIITSKNPYGRPKAKKFLGSVKSGNYQDVAEYIEDDPYLVYVFDEVGMTGLHWAAKRNYPNIISLLLSNKAIIDSVDTTHRSPLFLAVKYSSIESIRCLLIKMADPSVKTASKKLPLHIAKTKIVEKMIKKAMIFHALYGRLSQAEKEQN